MKLSPTEAEWQAIVIDLAHLHGWQVMHVHPMTSRRGTRTPTSTIGWPDLVLWRPGQILYRELKTDRGRITAAQTRVLASLDAAGGDVGVWRPKDWDQVHATLTS